LEKFLQENKVNTNTIEGNPKQFQEIVGIATKIAVAKRNESTGNIKQTGADFVSDIASEVFGKKEHTKRKRNQLK